MQVKKPNFVIIGSAKCGTTTLAAILDSHPDCCFSHPKEMYFFQDRLSPAACLWSRQEHFPKNVYAQEDLPCNRSVPRGSNPNYAKGWGWYRKAWLHYNGEPLVGEATPDYSDRTYSPGTAARMYSFNPAFKIVYMVREPVARMVSHWQMWRRHATDGITKYEEAQRAAEGFESYMTAISNSKALWDQVRYHYQLEPYLKHFPRANILVSFLEDWRVDETLEIQRILSFLELDIAKLHPSNIKPRNIATQLKRHSGLQRLVAKSALRPIIKQALGPALWSLLATTCGRSSYQSATPEIHRSTLQAFLQYIVYDNHAFLDEWGKPSSYWTPKKVFFLQERCVAPA